MAIKRTTHSCNNTDKPQMYYAKWKKQDIKGCILYDSTDMTFLKTVKLKGQKTNLWLPGPEGEWTGLTTMGYKGTF